MEMELHVYLGNKGEKKHSRRYHTVNNDDAPIRDLYVMRPWSNGKSKLIVTLDEKE